MSGMRADPVAPSAPAVTADALSHPLDAAIATASRHVAMLVLLALLVYGALVAWAGSGDALAAMRRISVAWLLLGMVITMAGFGLRIVRWRMFLAALGPAPDWRRSAVIYMAGIGMTATPGRVGEALRAVFLLRHGVPMGTGMAVTFMDRLSDVIAMVLMAWVATLAASHAFGAALAWGWGGLLVLVLAASVLFRGALTALPRARWLQRLLARPRLAWAGHWLGQAAASYRAAWRPRLVLPSVALSLLAFGLQALLFAGLAQWVAPGVPVAALVMIFAVAALAGAASMIPGGIGAMDLSLVAMLHQQGLGLADATAVTVVLRVATFWFSQVLGAMALATVASSVDKVRSGESTPSA